MFSIFENLFDKINLFSNNKQNRNSKKANVLGAKEVIVGDEVSKNEVNVDKNFGNINVAENITQNFANSEVKKELKYKIDINIDKAYELTLFEVKDLWIYDHRAVIKIKNDDDVDIENIRISIKRATQCYLKKSGLVRGFQKIELEHGMFHIGNISPDSTCTIILYFITSYPEGIKSEIKIFSKNGKLNFEE